MLKLEKLEPTKFKAFENNRLQNLQKVKGGHQDTEATQRPAFSAGSPASFADMYFSDDGSYVYYMNGEWVSMLPYAFDHKGCN